MEYTIPNESETNQQPKFGILCPINTNTFPGKLWKLVNDDGCSSVSWNHAGSGILINPRLFKEEVLHCDEYSMFKTQNFSSFVRQLNLYGFRKMALANKIRHGQCVSKELQMHHFQHPYFIRSRPDMLNQVRRAGARKRSRDFIFGCESENVSPALVKRNEGVSVLNHSFPGWGLTPKSVGGYTPFPRSFPLAEATDRRRRASSYMPYDDSPLLDARCSPFPPTLTLPQEQHPFRRADTGLSCALHMTWMGNIARGSLTSGNFGTAPETLVENERLRRFVLIPDDAEDFPSGLRFPSNQYLETFRPKLFSPNDMLNVPLCDAGMTPPNMAHFNDHQTTLSWSSTSPIVTTGHTRSLYADERMVATDVMQGMSSLNDVTPSQDDAMSDEEEEHEIILIKAEPCDSD